MKYEYNDEEPKQDRGEGLTLEANSRKWQHLDFNDKCPSNEGFCGCFDGEKRDNIQRNTDKVVERQLTSRLIQRFLDISLVLKLLYVIPLWEEQGA
jgi:hypothetical protein